MSMSLHGGPISRRPVAITDDGQLLLAPCGRSVKVFAAATGEQCGTLDGHTAEVTCVALNPADPSQVISASLDGTLRLWDYTAGTCLHVYAVREAVRHMVIHAHLSQAYLSIDWRDGQSGRVISYSLLKGRAGASAMKTRAAGPLAMQPRGTLVATIDRHSLFVWRTGPEISQPLNLHHTKPYTCLAISADESVLAAGDVSGRILIWRDLTLAVPLASRTGQHSGKQQPQVPPVLSTLHWHSGPVGCLTFSPDTTFLRSGGREGVLVSWQLDSNRPQFLPRLGAPIVGLEQCVHDPAMLLMRQADNTLRLVNLASNQVESSVLGLRPRPPACSAAATTLATSLQPGTGLLSLPTGNATLQLYNTQHHRHVALLQVAPRNDVSATDGEAAPAPQVAHAVYTHDGKCLATVDLRLDAGPYGTSEASLKFWDAVPGTGSTPFVLNTLVDDPHRGPVTCVVAHPSQPLIVTAGAGNALPALNPEDSLGLAMSVSSSVTTSEPEFKVWERVAAARRPGGKVEAPSCWRCRSVGTFKGLAFTAGAFSPDGSLLALAAQSKVTLWDPVSNNLVGVLPTPAELLLGGGEGAAPRFLRTLVFCPGTPYLVGTSDSVLCVWDLLRMSVHWSVALPCCSLAADPVHPLFAVALPSASRASSAKRAAAGQEPQSAAPANPVPNDGQEPETEQGQGTAAAVGSLAGRRTRRSSQAASAVPLSGQGATEQAVVGAIPAAAQAASDAAAIVTTSAPPFPETPECHVVVFNPASPRPLLACCVRDAAHVQLLFLAPGTPQFQDATSTPSAPGEPAVTPLLLLTADRGYELVSTCSMERDSAMHAVPSKSVSAFEAAFGALKAAPVVAALGVEGEAGGRPRWQQLLDAPSHALPPPTQLAAAFMQLLVQEARQQE